MTRRRVARRRVALAVLALPAAALLAVGCGSPGGAESAGPTRSAVGPARLWPDLPPPPTESQDDVADDMTEAVPGISVPRGELRSVDPVRIVQAEAAAHPDTYTGADALPDDTARAVARCGEEDEGDGDGDGDGDEGDGDEGRGGDTADCPVLKAYYRDMTGDGRDELIVGITFSDGSLGIRCYRVDDQGRLMRIMSTAQPVISVEVAGRDLVVHSPAHIADYEYRDVWSWDAQQKAMLPKRLEIISARADGGVGTSPAPSAARS
ncbi:hypothetical protein ACX6XY_25405 [Streptomyces sp. O3]